jgi:hypothetical protein
VRTCQSQSFKLAPQFQVHALPSTSALSGGLSGVGSGSLHVRAEFSLNPAGLSLSHGGNGLKPPGYDFAWLHLVIFATMHDLWELPLLTIFPHFLSSLLCSHGLFGMPSGAAWAPGQAGQAAGWLLLRVTLLAGPMWTTQKGSSCS